MTSYPSDFSQALFYQNKICHHKEKTDAIPKALSNFINTGSESLFIPAKFLPEHLTFNLGKQNFLPRFQRVGNPFLIE